MNDVYKREGSPSVTTLRQIRLYSWISPNRVHLQSLRTSFVSKDLTNVHRNPSGLDGLVNKQGKVKERYPCRREAARLFASSHLAAETRLSERVFEMEADGFGMLAGHDFRQQRAGARLRKRSNHPFHARQARHAHAEAVDAHAEQGERRHRNAGTFPAHAHRLAFGKAGLVLLRDGVQPRRMPRIVQRGGAGDVAVD